MLDKTSLEFLERFMMTSSPSGYEMEAAKCFREYLANYCTVKADVMGNSIAVLNENALLAEVAQECGVTGSRIMGGGFGGCTINLVKAELYDAFVAKAKAAFAEKYGHEPVEIPVVISDGARRLS